MPDLYKLRAIVCRSYALLTIYLPVIFLTGCATTKNQPVVFDSRHFLSLTDFSGFSSNTNPVSGEIVLTSPEIITPRVWDEFVVSWNVHPGVYLKVEARANYPGHTTKFYTMGLWSDDPSRHPRESVNGQADADGDAHTDTLVLNLPATNVQVRLTIGGASATDLKPIKFVGLSFCDSHAPALTLEPSRQLWGRSLDVPQRVQSGFDGPGGWCSPASLSMVLAYWSAKLHRPELDRPVPEVAAAVNDPVYGGTGNWPFNTAYAGQFPGLRAYVTRLAGISELEQWIAAGVPVVLSVSSYLTNDRHDGPDNGHLVVCVGFTKNGDVVVNDPGVSVKRGESVRRIYPRERVINAWKKSKNTVYLVHPETQKIPDDPHGHWE